MRSVLGWTGVLPGGTEPARALPTEFFAGDARDVARALLGKLLRSADGRAARMVEVEAYLGLDDPGSHARRGPTPRSAIMFGPPGRLYVYFSYGSHWCANVVCREEGTASAVLLRAAQPVRRLDLMREARQLPRRRVGATRDVPERDLCRGPGRLAQAFSITGADNHAVVAGEAAERFWFEDDGHSPGWPVVATARVGLSRGAELPWRFVVAGSRWASGPSGAR
ncbi:MAG TPA: DNA-3-methyladenine glycosylase [Acidimicrobiales bacterium]|nr:DNA-3-methyladenine glycosylase [Acidimicrobiales bacterium]